MGNANLKAGRGAMKAKATDRKNAAVEAAEGEGAEFNAGVRDYARTRFASGSTTSAAVKRKAIKRVAKPA